MSPSATSRNFLRKSRKSYSTTFLDSPYQCMTSLSMLLNIQLEPPLGQLEAISSHHITCHLREKIITLTTAALFQVVTESNELSPQPPFCSPEQKPQFPQWLLIILFFLVSSPDLLLSSVHTQASQYPCHSEGPQTGHNIWKVVSPMPSTGGQSLP